MFTVYMRLSYVPNSMCKLLDGNYVTHLEQQILGPLCDPNQNGDLFPELRKVDGT